jgi:hypothetical protein
VKFDDEKRSKHMYRRLTQQFAPSYASLMNQVNLNLFQRAYRQGIVSRVWEAITGCENHLVDLTTLTKGKRIGSRHYQGCQMVNIDKIIGSEGRCEDFDRSFNPRKAHNKERWMNIANAQMKGISLPVVELIKINDAYVVRDGHHRISVAKAIGSQYVEAIVTVWDVA